MITHKEAIINLTSCAQIDLDLHYKYIKQQEAQSKELKREIVERQETENSLTKWVNELTDELNELKRDVKRFMELIMCDSDVSFDEYLRLENKLSKVGKENE